MTKLGKTWTDEKKVCEFKQIVYDSDYKTEVRTYTGAFAQLIKVVRNS